MSTEEYNPLTIDDVHPRSDLGLPGTQEREGREGRQRGMAERLGREIRAEKKETAAGESRGVDRERPASCRLRDRRVEDA